MTVDTFFNVSAQTIFPESRFYKDKSAEIIGVIWIARLTSGGIKEWSLEKFKHVFKNATYYFSNGSLKSYRALVVSLQLCPMLCHCDPLFLSIFPAGFENRKYKNLEKNQNEFDIIRELRPVELEECILGTFGVQTEVIFQDLNPWMIKFDILESLQF